jgi:hypothetical protein
MPPKALLSVAWAALYGILYWVLDHFLYDWFVQYLATTFDIKVANVIASVSNYVIPALLSGAIIWGVYQLGRREIAGSRGDSAQSVSDQLPLNRAAYLIAHRSAWGRNFAAEYLIRDNCVPTSEQNLMQNVAYLLTEAAMKGHVEIKGQKVGEIQFDRIHPDTWQSICLDIQPDHKTLWRASIKYNSPLTKEQKDRVSQYNSLSISESALRREWPEKDRKIDVSTRRILRKARRFGINQHEIDKLWPQ